MSTINKGYIYIVIHSIDERKLEIGSSEEDPALSQHLKASSSVLIYRKYIPEGLDWVQKSISREYKDSQLKDTDNFFQNEPYKIIESIEKITNAPEQVPPATDTSPSIQWNTEGYTLFDEGCNYYYGRSNIPQDYGKALDLFEKASQKGVLPAYIYLGRMYEYGDMGEVNVTKALAYYEAGAERGSNSCNGKIASLYWRNSPLKNVEEGATYWHKYFTNLDHTLVTKDDYSNFNFYISLALENQLEVNFANVLAVYKKQMLELLQMRKDICNEQHTDNLPFKKYMLNVIESEMALVEALEQKETPDVPSNFAISSDILNISNMGVIILADVQRGNFQNGDTIQINTPGKTVTTKIQKIERYQQFTETATVGDNVGFLIDEKDEDYRFVKGGASILTVE
ncbi:MAG: hypothetical protein LRY73_16950 [Bacillus sp. (in: Bacteria)]|nr:hypothetical protein [Bacillus sp. (in: firmicutes)]